MKVKKMLKILEKLEKSYDKAPALKKKRIIKRAASLERKLGMRKD